MRRCFVFFLGVSLLFLSPTKAVQDSSSPDFKVAVTDCPPYAFKDTMGKWTGITVDLWDQIAHNLGYRYHYVELSPHQITEALRTGACDLSVCDMPTSPEAKTIIDFTEPYLATRLLVALHHFVLTQEIAEFSNSLKNNGFFTIFLVMMVGLIIFSLFLWLAERNNESGHFSRYLHHGLGSALWFGAVTMTTNGYGDKVPKTLLGRMITFIWMITGMVLIAVLTGTIISSITLAAEHSSMKRITDLAHYKNGVMKDNYAEKTLKSKGIPTKKFESFEEGLEALCNNKITAFVGDSISLQYLIAHYYQGSLRLASIPSGTIYRSLALRPGLPQKKEINLELLKITSPPEWNDHIEQWTGPLTFGH